MPSVNFQEPVVFCGEKCFLSHFLYFDIIVLTPITLTSGIWLTATGESAHFTLLVLTKILYYLQNVDGTVGSSVAS